MNWTDERVELLKKLWSEGLSASQIAAELGGVTRNAVIGKVHRLGLSGRAKAVAAPAARPRKPRPTTSAPAARPMVQGNTALAPVLHPVIEPEPVEMPDPVANVVPMADRCTILNLTEFTCRWPVGDPGKADFFYCGSRTKTGLPYCAYHARIAYQPVQDRNRRRVAR
ncbi:GcrA family cell cycle regulator [Ancylobacter sp. WKF20]|uniref:GcrA family cell cycle regulator n=1 Tax=Ancylobacter sp. WKF20 TaxID=3039801 RepID=UPI002434143D|nr:GcrA family cell cycle regulator [Ancylobacter sp. WKF20]WGD29994.1 GcrA family cell cycle regulator [Ancylobacter sp. WKF20]